MSDKTASQQIDDIIKQHAGWKGDIVKRLRAVIHNADQNMTEEIKWKTASRPEGLPVWMHDGIVCFVEIWKDNVKLMFFKGAHLADADNLFNARLKSADVRAVEFHEGDSFDEAGVKSLVIQAVEYNAAKAKR